MISGWLLMLILTFSKGGQLMQLMPFLIGIIILVLVCLWLLKKNGRNKPIPTEL